ncbi:MAG: 23S rRNA (pseudouridine(1915)-N(3))-methyltransferase RlmH [Saprospiraceae bacterium]|nr:23S rRNA (pseudouridine(1915)-N(3))-methyltransferase RlmH [Bacteroidia bacterium]NNF21891.1 23S rRNA (pseudouridine(1915)-N(3))-methyltransferase RlmH [Saprospiraceae bacterium]
MKTRLIYQGKSGKNHFDKAEDMYLSRIKKYISFDIQQLQPLKLSNALSVEEIRKKEEEYFLKKLPTDSLIILLDEKGKSYNSSSFSKFLDKMTSFQSKKIIFVIGGAFGFSNSMKQRADHIVRLSDMTMAHHLARIVFLEQLYRAFTIIKGEPYHNA